ncbi:MAG: YaiI/YqxD family protein [Planctomycetales bacterium]|nr:YaiI/YqxD family protein [Planctomycetales bacterium]
MKIWIDADAAPREVKEIVFRAARRLKIDTILVANQSVAPPLNAPTVSVVTVSFGANVADQHIVEQARAGDLVITADIPLASQLVAKQIAVIDPRGEEYHADNIASRLSMRDFMDSLRGAGNIVGGSKPYSELNKKAFAATFDRLTTKLMKQSKAKVESDLRRLDSD